MFLWFHDLCSLVVCAVQWFMQFIGSYGSVVHAVQSADVYLYFSDSFINSAFALLYTCSVHIAVSL